MEVNPMVWKERIVMDPLVLNGKPVIRGTRLAPEFILALLAEGWAREDLLVEYPGLEEPDILACLAYAAEMLKAEKVYPLAG
jgi:uncharacterized protein (DUF433 family)